jgi:hypothetical protein
MSGPVQGEEASGGLAGHGDLRGAGWLCCPLIEPDRVCHVCPRIVLTNLVARHSASGGYRSPSDPLSEERQRLDSGRRPIRKQFFLTFFTSGRQVAWHINSMGNEVNRHCIRMSIVALAAGAFGLISVAGPAQALAESGNTANTTASISAPSTSATVSVTLPTVAPNDSSWD